MLNCASKALLSMSGQLERSHLSLRNWSNALQVAQQVWQTQDRSIRAGKPQPEKLHLGSDQNQTARPLVELLVSASTDLAAAWRMA
jgi:hypothetical protein